MAAEGDTALLPQLQDLLLGLLPADGSAVGNGRLFLLLQAQAAGRGLRCGEAQFAAAREALVAAGRVLKGRVRGGSTARLPTPAAVAAHPATQEAARPDFELQGEVVPAELPFDEPKPRRAAPRPTGPDPGEPQVLSYRHADRRKNNPEVGLVNTDSDPESPRTTWAYDPHLDPALQFDSARAGTERLIDEALPATTRPRCALRCRPSRTAARRTCNGPARPSAPASRSTPSACTCTSGWTR